MNKRQKEVQQQILNREKAVLSQLERNYRTALNDINQRIEQLLSRQDADMQHVIYQVEYQKALRSEVQGILARLQANEFTTISAYLTAAYKDGFVGTMYDLHGQGVPVISEIDERQVAEAVQHETPISQNLYTSLGKDVKEMQKQIAAEISRGIATSLPYADIARNIAAHAGISKNKAMRIARTEAHRIQNKAAFDAQHKASDAGAIVVKQWDAALDGRTRKSHRKLDGQIRELDEPFEVDGKKAMYPGGFGRPEEDIHCRCVSNQRAKWALDEEELKILQKRAEYFGLDRTNDFADYRKKYMKAAAKVFQSPTITGAVIKKNIDRFTDALEKSEGVASHVMKMRLHAEYVEYEENLSLEVPFAYNEEKDVIEYNPEAPNFDLYDMNFVQAHELSHRMDVLEYDSASYAEFTSAVDICGKRVMENAEEIQKWFDEGGKFENADAFSDIISALSNAEINVPVGHIKEYWSKGKNVLHEIFANISAIDVLDSETRKAVEFLLKELFEAYEDIVK